MIAGQGKIPSPHKVVFNIPSGSEGDEANDEELAQIFTNKQESVVEAKGTNIPIMLDPRVLLDFINLWYQNL